MKLFISFVCCYVAFVLAPVTKGETFKYEGKRVPSTIAEVFDFEEIQGADIYSDLQVMLTGDYVEGGIRYVDGTWISGEYSTVNEEGVVQTIILNNAFHILIPIEYHELNLIVFPGHEYDKNPLTRYDNRIRGMVKNGNAFFIYGQDKQDWEELGWTDLGRTRLLQLGIFDLEARNCDGCGLTDLQTSNFGYAMARTQMLQLRH